MCSIMTIIAAIMIGICLVRMAKVFVRHGCKTVEQRQKKSNDLYYAFEHGQISEAEYQKAIAEV